MDNPEWIGWCQPSVTWDGIVLASLPIQQLKGLAGNATRSTEADISALPEGIILSKQNYMMSSVN